MLVTDARYVTAAPGRPRRGMGAWMALLVAGETVALADFAPKGPSAAELEGLQALGLVAIEAAATDGGGGASRGADGGGGASGGGARLRPLVRALPWGGLVVVSPPDDAFDVSALNVAATLPARAGSVWDVGCGAGLVGLVAARAGARVFASDVHGSLVETARLNAALNGFDARVEVAVADLFAVDGARVCDVVAFNAPLLRAPLAVADDGADGPRYTSTPEGEALALRFLAAAPAHAREAILLHAQLTPAVAAALDELATRVAVTTVVFAHAPDGTPHALSELRLAAPPSLRRLFVPLSPACPHLGRAIFDGLAASFAAAGAGADALAGDLTPLPAPWLELRTRERFEAGARRALGTTFGGVTVDADEVALLERLRGEPLSLLALTSTARERLYVMIERGHVIVR